MAREVVFNDPSTWVEAVWEALDQEQWPSGSPPDDVATAMAWIEEALVNVQPTRIVEVGHYVHERGSWRWVVRHSAPETELQRQQRIGGG